MLSNKEILISKYLSGNANSGEIKKLTDWLKDDPSNQAEFDGIEKLWNISLNLKKDKDADVERAWNEFKLLTESQPEIRIRKINYGWLKVAAAVTLFVVTTVVIKIFFTQSQSITPVIVAKALVNSSSEPVTVSTPDMSPVVLDSINFEAPVKSPSTKRAKKVIFPSDGNVAMITVIAGDSAQFFLLPDNTVVYLNTNSKLEYPQNFNKNNHRVTLIGEAYFDVKSDSDELIVACEKTIVRGKKTMFNVKSYASDKDVEVIIASGSVEFSGVGYKDVKKLVLTNGESGYYDKAKSVITKSKSQRKNYKWWQKESLRAKIKGFFDRLLGKKN